MAKIYRVTIEFDSKAEQSQLIDEISNQTESLWADYEGLIDYNALEFVISNKIIPD